mgnify:FL=1
MSGGHFKRLKEGVNSRNIAIQHSILGERDTTIRSNPQLPNKLIPLIDIKRHTKTAETVITLLGKLGRSERMICIRVHGHVLATTIAHVI